MGVSFGLSAEVADAEGIGVGVEEAVGVGALEGVGETVGLGTLGDKPFHTPFGLSQERIPKHSNGVPWKIPKPSAFVYLAVANPITRPVLSNTGPPELPGLIAAFVVPFCSP